MLHTDQIARLQESFHNNPEQQRSSSPTILEECKVEDSKWPRPNDLSKLKYQDVLQSEQILSFLVEKFNDIGSPITLMFGTLLREFRNGTKTGCLRPDYHDKDFDIAVSPKQFYRIVGLREELKLKFNASFHFTRDGRRRNFASIGTKNKLFNVDVYAYECKKEEGLIYFPWDMITIAMDSFFPVRRHKRILPFVEQHAGSQPNSTTAKQGGNNTITDAYNVPAFYFPNDPPCLLENIYGADYMTPRSGKEVQAKYGTSQGRLAHGNPVCDTSLSPYYQREFERQIKAFC